MSGRRIGGKGMGLLAVAMAGMVAFHWRAEILDRSNRESKYQGRPTSSWRRDLQRWEVCATITYGNMFSSHTTRFRQRRPSVWKKWLNLETDARWAERFSDHPLLQGDPAAVPVLVELLKDSDPEIRLIALEALCNTGTAAKAAVPVLLDALHDDNREVRTEAERSLLQIDEPAASAAGLRRGW